ncbi:hypothetical protein LCGC14_1399180 [marine sediment metagenome]|uniref:Uncharacterized protein n=1 Tax=marine sediment metagenome TaxID=412755 RepID=A0A0F9JXM8_9ZZZZ
MDIYGTAWKNLERKIAATRRQSISKADLVLWQLEALEQAVDEYHAADLLKPPPPEARAIRRHAGIED